MGAVSSTEVARLVGVVDNTGAVNAVEDKEMDTIVDAADVMDDVDVDEAEDDENVENVDIVADWAEELTLEVLLEVP